MTCPSSSWSWSVDMLAHLCFNSIHWWPTCDAVQSICKKKQTKRNKTKKTCVLLSQDCWSTKKEAMAVKVHFMGFTSGHKIRILMVIFYSKLHVMVTGKCEWLFTARNKSRWKDVFFSISKLYVLQSDALKKSAINQTSEACNLI